MQNNSFSVLFFIYFLDTNVEGSTDGLLAYWKFNEGNGKTIKDHSGNGNTLEAEKGNPTWVSVALPEKNNIKFNNSYLTTGLRVTDCKTIIFIDALILRFVNRLP